MLGISEKGGIIRKHATVIGYLKGIYCCLFIGFIFLLFPPGYLLNDSYYFSFGNGKWGGCNSKREGKGWDSNLEAGRWYSSQEGGCSRFLGLCSSV